MPPTLLFPRPISLSTILSNMDMFGHCISSRWFLKVILVWRVCVVSLSSSTVFTSTPEGVWGQARQPNSLSQLTGDVLVSLLWLSTLRLGCRCTHSRVFPVEKDCRTTVKGSFIQFCTPGPGPQSMRPLSFSLWARHTPNVTALTDKLLWLPVIDSDRIWLHICDFQCI